jgi:hypothetical protein
MPWDDFAPFLVGSGPTSTVLDPDANPNTILEENRGGSVKVDWSFTGIATSFLAGTTFTVSVYAESIGGGPEKLVGSPVDVPGGAGPLTATVVIPPGSLPADTPPDISGVYELTAVITHRGCSRPPAPTALSGFVHGPIIQVRNP